MFVMFLLILMTIHLAKKKNDVSTPHDQNHVQDNSNITYMSCHYCNQNVNILIQYDIHVFNLSTLK